MVNPDKAFWQGRRVLLTGHTGFKGGWLALWLSRLGAAVHGYALDPLSTPSLFDVAHVKNRLAGDHRADLANLAMLKEALTVSQPEIIFHLAAQPLVRASYRDPLATLSTNIMGTAHVLEAARTVPSVRAIVVITTDKVYVNREWVHPYREIDPLGGHDPYSASKAAAELVVSSYRDSFFSNAAARIATARAGNVIGGGDWSEDRLIPDCLRSFQLGEAVQLRFPDAIRPWQHVLEPLAGYLLLAQHLCSDRGDRYATAWNFGPDADGEWSVGEMASEAARLWGESADVVRMPSTDNPHEAGVLRLDSSRARNDLRWRPRWSVRHAIARTVTWRRAWMHGNDMAALCLQQIGEYEGTMVS